jgi:putative permease
VNNISILLLAVISLILYLAYNVSGALTPFIVSFIFSYLLQPVIAFFSDKLKLKKTYIISLIILGFISLIILSFILLVPILLEQISRLILILPTYKSIIQNDLLPVLEVKIAGLDPELSSQARQVFSESLTHFADYIMSIFNNFWTYTKATIGILILIFLVPIISFHLLLSWTELISSIYCLFPKKYKNKILKILNEIDGLISAYVRGQLNICLILTFYYSTILSFIGLEFSILLGILSGFLLIIPFFGTLIAITVSLLITYLTFENHIYLLYTFLTYVVGHIFEAYILSPKIIGNKLGINPLWILFAVIICTSLFGFLGTLFAIPLAGIIKVLVVLLVEAYKDSKFYK